MSPPRRRRDDHRRVCRRHACRRGLRRRAHRRREVRHGAGGTGSDHPDGAEHGLRWAGSGRVATGGWRRRSSLSRCRLRCSSLSSVSPRSSPGSTRFVVWTPLAWLFGHWLEGTTQRPRGRWHVGPRLGAHRSSSPRRATSLRPRCRLLDEPLCSASLGWSGRWRSRRARRSHHDRSARSWPAWVPKRAAVDETAAPGSAPNRSVATGSVLGVCVSGRVGRRRECGRREC